MGFGIVRPLDTHATIDRVTPAEGSGLEHGDLLSGEDGFLEGFLRFEVNGGVHVLFFVGGLTDYGKEYITTLYFVNPLFQSS